MKQADIAKLKDDPVLFCETFFEESIPDFSKEMLAMLNKRLKPCNKFVCPPRRFPKLPSFMETAGCDLLPGMTGTHKDGIVVMIDECGVGGMSKEILNLIKAMPDFIGSPQMYFQGTEEEAEKFRDSLKRMAQSNTDDKK